MHEGSYDIVFKILEELFICVNLCLKYSFLISNVFFLECHTNRSYFFVWDERYCKKNFNITNHRVPFYPYAEKFFKICGKSFEKMLSKS